MPDLLVLHSTFNQNTFLKGEYKNHQRQNKKILKQVFEKERGNVAMWEDKTK